MHNRFSNALAIQQGACNPSGVARSLVQAIDEARAENPGTASVCADPAVRLICHQLAFLLNVGEIDSEYGVYNKLIGVCLEKADDGAVKDAIGG